MTKIESATAEQWKRIDEIREWWVDAQTDQYADEDIRETCRAMWHELGQSPPTVLVLDSPMACELAAAMLPRAGEWIKDQLGHQLGYRLECQLNAQLSAQLSDRLWCQLWRQLSGQLDDLSWSQLSGQLFDQLKDQLGGQINDQLNDPLSSQLWDQLSGQLFDQLRSQLWDQFVGQLSSELWDQGHASPVGYNSIWWQAWAGWFEGADLLGVQFDRHKYDLFRRWCLHCTYVVPFSGLAIVSRRSVEVHWQDSRLHNASGPAVRYSDGYSLWSIGGVAVDEQIVMRPETQTVEQIRKEGNEEVKRIRIERYGWVRFLTDCGANRIDSRRNDIEGTRESLYVTPDGMLCLVCACPSTAKVFALEVLDDTISTCEQAQSWLSSGLSGRIISAS